MKTIWRQFWGFARNGVNLPMPVEASVALCVCALFVHATTASGQFVTFGTTNTWDGRLISLTGPSSFTAVGNNTQFTVDYTVNLLAGVTDPVYVSNAVFLGSSSDPNAHLAYVPLNVTGTLSGPGSELVIPVTFSPVDSGGMADLNPGTSDITVTAIGYDLNDSSLAVAQGDISATVTSPFLVPEPSSLALLVSAGAGLCGWLGWRRIQNVTALQPAFNGSRK